MRKVNIDKEALEHFMNKQAADKDFAANAELVRALSAGMERRRQSNFEQHGGIDAMGDLPPSRADLRRAARQFSLEKRVAGDRSSELKRRWEDKGPWLSITAEQRKAQLEYLKKRLSEVRELQRQKLDRLQGSESKTI